MPRNRVKAPAVRKLSAYSAFLKNVLGDPGVYCVKCVFIIVLSDNLFYEFY